MAYIYQPLNLWPLQMSNSLSWMNHVNSRPAAERPIQFQSEWQYILDGYMTFWGEPERLYMNNVEQLHAHDCHRKLWLNIAQPQATERHKSKHMHSYMHNTGKVWSIQCTTHTGTVSLSGWSPLLCMRTGPSNHVLCTRLSQHGQMKASTLSLLTC